jgi:transglutaminase-like putative cysteine protease
MPERFVGWVLRLITRYWVTLILTITLVTVLAYSLDEANWVRNDSPLIFCLLAGIVFGWMLATSRFHRISALLYSLMLAIVVPIQGVGQIIPPLGRFFSSPAEEIFSGINLNGLAFSLRVGGWIETLQAGENIQDNGLFVLLLGAILTVCGIWLMWTMIRQRRVLNGLLPLALLMGVNVHLSHQPLTNYMIFLLSGLLLVARTSFNAQHEEWRRRRVDFPEQLGLEWGGSALAIVLLVVMVARLAPLFGTAEGWRAVSEWINRYHEQTSDTATRLFSGVKPPPQPDAKQVIFVNTPNMGEIGVPIAQGSQTIMWVTISDPAPIPREIGISANLPVELLRIHYWRNGIYSSYTGRGWQTEPMAGSAYAQITALPKDNPPGRYYLRQAFSLEAKHTGALFSVNEPLQVDQGVALRQSQVDVSTELLEGKASMYQVISAATQVTANELEAAPVDYPQAVRAAYLQLPDELPERVRILARRLVSGARDPYHKALAVQNYLRENYTYNLAVPQAPPSRDVVDYFLFDQQAGFCSHYASAMVVLLRAVGVPARVVTGYAMGDYSPERGAFRVPESAAHAWVEVYFPGYDWVEFEPTAGRDSIEYPETADTGTRPRVSPAAADQKSKLEARPYLLGLLVVGALVLLTLPFLLLRMFSTTRQAPLIQVPVLYRRVRRLLAWAGLPAPPSVTPDEYLACYSGQLEPYERLNQALSQVTTLYRETIYSPHPPDELRVRKASWVWQQSIGEWISLWLKAAWQRIKARWTG